MRQLYTTMKGNTMTLEQVTYITKVWRSLHTRQPSCPSWLFQSLLFFFKKIGSPLMRVIKQHCIIHYMTRSKAKKVEKAFNWLIQRYLSPISYKTSNSIYFSTYMHIALTFVIYSFMLDISFDLVIGFRWYFIGWF
jgi:hypothetical protein